MDDFVISRFWVVGVLLVSIGLMSLPLLTTVSLDLAFDVFFWLGVSVGSFFVTKYRMLPGLEPFLRKAGMTGKDIYKKGKPGFEEEIVECLGLGVAVVYLGSLLLMSWYLRVRGLISYAQVAESGVCYVACGTFLGFVDDVLELRWRDKLVFPFFFSLPLIMSYEGPGHLLLPDVLAEWLGFSSVPLGPLLPVYLVALSIFCVNSINIYAGVSGLESGQSLIIGLTLMLENLACILRGESRGENLASFYLLGPFCAGSLALLIANSPEKKTFVGDTFVYFAGCVVAFSSVSGRFPFKVLFFLLPQVANFLLSVPQIFGLMPCPRHRLPRPDESGRLVTTCPQNWNNINVFLRVTGPLSERKLGTICLVLQAVLGVAAVGVSSLLSFSHQEK